jgi:hypothetical protein
MNMTATKIDMSELLAGLRSVIDEREELARQDKILSERKSRIERELMQFHESTGLESCSGAGMSVTFNDDAMRAKYDPEQWPGIVKWAVESGHDYIIQRRLTDAKILDLVANGVALPEGLTLEPFVKMNIRRK